MSLEVVPIHKHPEYLHECCKIINQEWKRSDAARLHSLKQSSDNLPTSLILLKDKIVIGHIKLSVIPKDKSACFVESVVIEKDLRGKGYGSFIMKEAENFCKLLGLETIYLSTKGQEQFYTKLGYEECAPVSLYGSFFSNNKTPKKPKENIQITQPKQNEPLLLIPPPPPPLPQFIKAKTNGKTYMKKSLC